MRYREIAELNEKDRKAKEQEIELELMKERAQIASGTSPKNPGMIREHRKTIARIRTLENHK